MILKIKNKPMPFYLKEFLVYMEIVKNRSERTVEAYYTDLSTFFKFLKLQKGLIKNDNFEFSEIDISDLPISAIQSVTLTDIYEFLSYTSDDRQNSAKTRARKTSAIRMFFKYLNVNTQYLPNNPAENIETPSIKNPLPKYLTLEQSIQLLNSVDGEYSKRDYCIITFFLNCGFRLSELVNIDITDIKENRIQVTGKGNKQRVLYLNEACQSALNDYLNDETRKSAKLNEALFVSRQGNRISKRRVQQVIENALKKCGFDTSGLSTHKLRHTAATLMYQYGNVDIRVLQNILGHEGLQTTQIYTHVADKQIEEAVEKSPLANIKKDEKSSKN